MKIISSTLVCILCALAAQANTYLIHSGKWNDPKIWGEQYIGNTIKAGDVVIITGQVVLNTELVIEGTLEIKTGAGITGMKNITVGKNGQLLNNGNAAVKNVVNRGYIGNNRVMDAMQNMESSGNIVNNSSMITGNNFTSTGGSITGKKGTFYINNTASISGNTKVGSEVKLFYGGAGETASAQVMLP